MSRADVKTGNYGMINVWHPNVSFYMCLFFVKKIRVKPLAFLLNMKV